MLTTLIHLCRYCGEPTRRVFAGDESVDYCDTCDKVVEGHTKTVTQEEYENLPDLWWREE